MNQRLTTLAIALAATAAAGVAIAGDDLTSLSYISYLERYATVKPAQGGETIDAVVNMPVLGGDRLETARRGRVEVQLADGSTLWVDEFTTVDFDALAFSRDDSAPRTVLFIDGDGAVAIEIPTTALGDGTMRVDTAKGTVYLNRPGLYRLEMGSGQLHVEAHSGLAELPSGAGSTLLRGGQEAYLSGEEDVQKNVLAASADDFWSWVEDRRHPADSGRTAEYVDSRASRRAAVLDSYGDWVYVPTFSSYMWHPRVAAAWTPYSCGRWVWTPVGWTWIAYEPWGWYPSHYGSWYLDASFGWVWGWDAVWGPAWVHWIYTPGYVGWCPRGYYDWWYYNSYHDRFHGGGRGPGRWSDAAIDFHGRVGLRDVDPRPWTLVPTDRFASPHLERVRVDTSRVFRDGGDRVGFVRSGPLLTRAPDRSGPERVIDSVLRSPGDERVVPGLSTVLRRGELPARGAQDLPLQPVRTNEIIRSVEREIPQRTWAGDNPRQERTTTRESVSDTPTRRLGWSDRPPAGSDPGTSVTRERTTAPQAGGRERVTSRAPTTAEPTSRTVEPAPRTVERRVTRSNEGERPAPAREAAPARGETTSRPAPPPSSSRPSGQSAPSSHASPPRPRAEPKEQPKSQSISYMSQERSVDRSWSSRSRAVNASSQLRRELVEERARVRAFSPAAGQPYSGRPTANAWSARRVAESVPALRGSTPSGQAFAPRAARSESSAARSWSARTASQPSYAPRAAVREAVPQLRAPSASGPAPSRQSSPTSHPAQRPHR